MELLAISSERKDSELCGEIIGVLFKIVDQWKEHTSVGSATICGMTDDEYQRSKYNCVFVTDQVLDRQYELYMELGRYDALVPVFKRKCDLEISQNLPIERQSSNNMWKIFRKVFGQFLQMPEEMKPLFKRYLDEQKFDEAWNSYEALTSHGLPDDVIRKALAATTIHDVPDEMISKILKMTNEMSPLEMSQERDVELKRCGQCSKQESACGDFKRCNRCKQIVYCSKKCQTSHWKRHKKECKASKK